MSIIAPNFVLLLVSVAILGPTFAASHDAKPMEGFAPDQFLGKWWFIRVTSRVFHRKEHCSHFVVSKKDDSNYQVLGQYTLTTSGGKSKQVMVDFLDEPEHPAMFSVYVGEKKVISATVLGTDYTHWAVIYVREGGFEAFTVASRERSLGADFEEATRKVLEDNRVTSDFIDMSEQGCPDDI